MNAQRLIGLGIAAVGVVLLIKGIRATDSFASQVSRFFTNEPTDRAIWLTLGGAVVILVGLGAAAIPDRSRGR